MEDNIMIGFFVVLCLAFLWGAYRRVSPKARRAKKAIGDFEQRFGPWRG